MADPRGTLGVQYKFERACWYGGRALKRAYYLLAALWAAMIIGIAAWDASLAGTPVATPPVVIGIAPLVIWPLAARAFRFIGGARSK